MDKLIEQLHERVKLLEGDKSQAKFYLSINPNQQNLDNLLKIVKELNDTRLLIGELST